jgi:hypothetical protein
MTSNLPALESIMNGPRESGDIVDLPQLWLRLPGRHQVRSLHDCRICTPKDATGTQTPSSSARSSFHDTGSSNGLTTDERYKPSEYHSTFMKDTGVTLPQALLGKLGRHHHHRTHRTHQKNTPRVMSSHL